MHKKHIGYICGAVLLGSISFFAGQSDLPLFGAMYRLSETDTDHWDFSNTDDSYIALETTSTGKGIKIYKDDGKLGSDYFCDKDGNNCSTAAGLSALDASVVIDDDADTQIQVEEGTDEDSIRFDTAGAEQMIIDANGNVGIGTSSPTYKFQVNSGNTDPSGTTVGAYSSNTVVTTSSVARASYGTLLQVLTLERLTLV